MLRAASLPPSMAHRERTAHKYDVCPRSYRDFVNKEKIDKANKYKFNYSLYEKELEELKNEFLGVQTKLHKPNHKRKVSFIHLNNIIVY